MKRMRQDGLPTMNSSWVEILKPHRCHELQARELAEMRFAEAEQRWATGDEKWRGQDRHKGVTKDRNRQKRS